MLTVRCLDPTCDPVDRAVAALSPLVVADAAEEVPYEPPPTLRALRALVVAPGPDPVRLLVAECDGRPVGCALVAVPVHDNLHVLGVDLFVDPAERRRGVGRALWSGVLALARQLGRSTLLLEARVDGPMAAFARAVGASPQLRNVVRQQAVAELDLAHIAELRRGAEHAARGHHLQAWSGPAAPEVRPLLAEAFMALNDAPLGGLAFDDEVWDAARVAQRDAAAVAAGLRLQTVLAVAPDGSAAGFTDVAVSEDGTHAWQWGTAVARAARGHRLGLLLKTVMIERLRAEEPALRTLSTWNAADNTHMIAVNVTLGYTPVDAIDEWQLLLADS